MDGKRPLSSCTEGQKTAAVKAMILQYTVCRRPRRATSEILGPASVQRAREDRVGPRNTAEPGEQRLAHSRSRGLLASVGHRARICSVDRCRTVGCKRCDETGRRVLTEREKPSISWPPLRRESYLYFFCSLVLQELFSAQAQREKESGGSWW